MAKTTVEYCNKCKKVTLQEWGVDKDGAELSFYLTCLSCGNMEEIK